MVAPITTILIISVLINKIKRMKEDDQEHDYQIYDELTECDNNIFM